MKNIKVVVAKKSIMIRKDGEYYILKRYKGVDQLIELLANPNKEYSCMLLTADDVLKVWEAERRMSRHKLPFDSAEYNLDSYHPINELEKDEIMDDRYFTEMKKEANHLIKQIAIAEQYNDIGRVENLKNELEQVTEYILKMTKANGKSKTMPNEFSKPIDSLRKSINKAICLIEANDRELANHLKKQIKIGRYCCYHSSGIEIECIYKFDVKE